MLTRNRRLLFLSDPLKISWQYPREISVSWWRSLYDQAHHRPGSLLFLQTAESNTFFVRSFFPHASSGNPP